MVVLGSYARVTSKVVKASAYAWLGLETHAYVGSMMGFLKRNSWEIGLGKCILVKFVCKVGSRDCKSPGMKILYTLERIIERGVDYMYLSISIAIIDTCPRSKHLIT